MTHSFQHGSAPSQFRDFGTLCQWLRNFWDAFYIARKGKLDCVGTVTLTANAATTVLADIRLSPESAVYFDPKTANAATEIYGATMYVLTANRGNASWTITHANNANADKTFQYTVIG